MVRIDITNENDWNAGDTNTQFQDATVTARVKVLIGQFDAPQGSKATAGGDKVFVEIFDDTTTAVREDGTFIFTALNNSTGNEVEIYRKSSRLMASAGQISVQSEWNFLPIGTVVGDSVRMYFESDATDILDSSDHNWIMPVTIV